MPGATATHIGLSARTATNLRTFPGTLPQVDILLICIVSLVAATLTLFSGFGLGTILMPVFAIFFPVPVAIAATAIVHLANNLFKFALLARKANPRVALWFGTASGAGALVGAWLLTILADRPALYEWSFLLASREVHAQITIEKLVVAFVMLAFALLELAPETRDMAFPPRFIVPGGALSGFFGGLSGHQGALRSAVLLRAGLSRESFIATGVVCAVIVDVCRLAVYGTSIHARHWDVLRDHAGATGRLLLAACLAAFAGSFIGARLMKKTTISTLRSIVGVGLVLLSVLLGIGLV
jgi:uncharacterized membrane protein YfcA